MDEAGGATQANLELTKKREIELQKLRCELEDTRLQAETSSATLRKKHADACAELTNQCDALHKMRTKLEKEKSSVQRDAEALQSAIESEQKQRAVAERLAKQLDAQLVEAHEKVDEQARQINELIGGKSRLSAESVDLNR